MASKNRQYSLNTENCATLNDLARKIYATLRKNDEILSRLTGLVDSKLRIPKFDQNDSDENAPFCGINGSSLEVGEEKEHVKSSTISSESELAITDRERKSISGGSMQSDNADSAERVKNGTETTSGIEQNDSLRDHLDKNLKLASVHCDKTRFEHVTSSRIRQLLQDNYRLLEIKKRKQQENRDLWRVYNTYERLFLEVIIPRLTQDVSKQNIDRIAAARDACLVHRFAVENDVWLAYCDYMGHLETVRSVVCKLVDLLNGHLQSEQTERLTAQMSIVENLIATLKTGELRRSRV